MNWWEIKEETESGFYNFGYSFSIGGYFIFVLRSHWHTLLLFLVFGKLSFRRNVSNLTLLKSFE